MPQQLLHAAAGITGSLRLSLDYPAASSWHINHKELLSVYLAACRWGHLWANSKVVIHTDSMVAQAILNKGTTRHKPVMQVLRNLFWLATMYNFDLTAMYIPGKENDRADAISRLHEPGQLLRLNNLLNYCLVPCHLLYHMHYKAFHGLAPQIRVWSALAAQLDCGVG